MSLLEETERYIAGESQPPTKALRLAARIEKAIGKATRAEEALLTAARERVLNHLLRDDLDRVRIQPAPAQAAAVRIQGPKGQRSPAAVVAIDRLSSDVRDAVTQALNLHTDAALESHKGIDVGAIDTIIATVFADQSATECLHTAREGEESYDYERALAGYQLAVVRSNGEINAVRSLVQFWSDIYADHQAIATLLSSKAIAISKYRDLQSAHANALEATGQYDEALSLVLALLAIQEEIVLNVQRARLLYRRGEQSRAAKVLRTVLKEDPNHSEASKLLKEYEAHIHGQADSTVESIQDAIERSDRETARSLLEEMAKSNQTHPLFNTLKKSVARLENQAEASALIQQAEALLEKEDWRGIRQRLMRAQEYCVDTMAPHGAFLQRAEAAVQAMDLRQYIANAERCLEQKEWAAALQAMHRAVEHEDALPPTITEHSLHALLQRSLNDVSGFKPSDRSFDGLASLFEAIQFHQGGQTASAQDALREAKRLLRSHPDITQLEEEVDRSAQMAELSRGDGLLSQAAALEKEGNIEQALAHVEQALSGQVTDRNDAIEWRDRLRETLKQTDQQESILNRWTQLAHSGRWWRLKRAMATEGMDSSRTEVVDLRQKMEKAIADQWSVHAVAHSTATRAGALHLDSMNWSAEQQADMLLYTPQDSTLWLGAHQDLIRVNAKTLEVELRLRLPDAIQVTRKHWRFFAHNEQLIFIDCLGRTATLLVGDCDSPQITHRIDLGRSLGREKEASTLAQEIQWCPQSERLLVLETAHGRGKKSRLRSIGIGDGQVHHAEVFPYPVFGLKTVRGDGRFTVQRMLDWSRPQANFYNFAVVDGKAKVLHRAAFPALELPMHSIRRLYRIDDENSGYLCQYWYIEPFTGQVAQHSGGLMHMKSDWSVYFQSTETEQWLREPRRLVGNMDYHRPSKTILYPWQDLKDGDAYGVSGIAVDGFEHAWSVPLPTGQKLEALIAPSHGEHTTIVSAGNQGTVLYRLDVDNRCLGT